MSELPNDPLLLIRKQLSPRLSKDELLKSDDEYILSYSKDLIDKIATEIHEYGRKSWSKEEQKVKFYSDGTKGDINVAFNELSEEMKVDRRNIALIALRAISMFPNDKSLMLEYVHLLFLRCHKKSPSSKLFRVYKSLESKQRQFYEKVIEISILEKCKDTKLKCKPRCICENIISALISLHQTSLARCTKSGEKRG